MLTAQEKLQFKEVKNTLLIHADNYIELADRFIEVSQAVKPGHSLYK